MKGLEVPEQHKDQLVFDDHGGGNANHKFNELLKKRKDKKHKMTMSTTTATTATDEIIANERNRRHHHHQRRLNSGCSQYYIEEIAVVFDSTFCAQQGGHAQAKTKLEAIISKSSFIYQRQEVCTKIKIASYEGHCSSNYDPYKSALATNNIGCNGATGVLQKFQEYWKKNRTTKPRTTAHLFFAKDFDETTIGCAYINTLCNKSYGYGTEDMNYSKNTYQLAVLFAHELGHNNALNHVSSSHDNPFIMGSHVKSGENVWSSESQTILHTTIPSKGCITKETTGNTCTDSPSGWHDADGANYNCGWYALGSNCADYGNGWKNNGYNAAGACCACGGGMSSFYTDEEENENENEKSSSANKNDEGTSTDEGGEITCGCSDSCTPSILETMVEGKTIKKRISWIVDNLNESEEEACELICGEEFDDICGKECNPSQCK